MGPVELPSPPVAEEAEGDTAGVEEGAPEPPAPLTVEVEGGIGVDALDARLEVAVVVVAAAAACAVALEEATEVALATIVLVVAATDVAAEEEEEREEREDATEALPTGGDLRAPIPTWAVSCLEASTHRAMQY